MEPQTVVFDTSYIHGVVARACVRGGGGGVGGVEDGDDGGEAADVDTTMALGTVVVVDACEGGAGLTCPRDDAPSSSVMAGRRGE